MDGVVASLTATLAAAWPQVELVAPLTGGARNPVFAARWGARRLVVRRSGRPAASLDWELDLLAHLRAHQIGVPDVVPASDGRRHVDGVLVHPFVAGQPPRDGRDWRRVVAVLDGVHELTAGWPQRPGFASSHDLLTADRGGDVRLDLMPEAGRAAVRLGLSPVADGPRCAIHGDLGAGNVLVDGAGVTLLDWDESRVDVPWFDFAFLPDEVDVPARVPVDRATLVTAGVAWEAATCWAVEPAYAARRLDELRERLGHPGPGHSHPY